MFCVLLPPARVFLLVCGEQNPTTPLRLQHGPVELSNEEGGPRLKEAELQHPAERFRRLPVRRHSGRGGSSERRVDQHLQAPLRALELL